MSGQVVHTSVGVPHGGTLLWAPTGPRVVLFDTRPVSMPMNECVSAHPGTRCSHSLPHDRRPGWRLWVQVGMCRIGSWSGKEGEVCEEQRRGGLCVLFAGSEMERTWFHDVEDGREIGFVLILEWRDGYV